MTAMTFLAAALLVAFDQASKLWAQASFASGESLPLGLGVSLTYVRNPGAAFGVLRRLAFPLGPVTVDGTFLLGLLSLGVSIWLVLHLLRHRGDGAWSRAALTMVLAGAVGNMIDRFRLGFVIDFVHFRVGWFDFPVFNLADVLVVGGATLLLLITFASPQERDRDAREAPGAADAHDAPDAPDAPEEV